MSPKIKTSKELLLVTVTPKCNLYLFLIIALPLALNLKLTTVSTIDDASMAYILKLFDEYMRD
jgi:hypothetical protein